MVETESEIDEEDDLVNAQLNQQLLQMQQMQQLQQQAGIPPPAGWGVAPPGRRNPLAGGRGGRLQASRNARQLAALGLDPNGQKKSKKEKRKKKRASKLEYKRVDQLWDSTIHNYKLTDTAEDEESSEYDQYLFNVRRTFDWEGKYKVCLCLMLLYTFIANMRRIPSSISRVSFLRRRSMRLWMVSRVSA